MSSARSSSRQYNYQTTSIQGDFQIELRHASPNIALSDQDSAAVEIIWQAERERLGNRLFNGQILSAVHYDAHRMIGRWVSYKEALAAYRSFELAQRLNILPVAVSGLTMAGDRMLFGERSTLLAQYPGYLELVPSGGIAPSCVREGVVDFRQALLEELYEEVGLLGSQVKRLTPFALMRDTHYAALEVCVQIDLDPGFNQALQSPHDEYTRFHWVSKQDAEAFLANWNGPVVELSRVIVRNKMDDMD